MTSGILKRILQTIDKQGIVNRCTDKETGEGYCPALILDGHISCIGLPFLKYVDDKYSKWGAFLVCLYGTSKTQKGQTERAQIFLLRCQRQGIPTNSGSFRVRS